MVKQPAVFGSFDLSIAEIQQLIPHRDPFLFVDSAVVNVQELSCSISAVCSLDDKPRIFDGHFPSQPLMPGVLELEAIAQTAAILYMYIHPEKVGSGVRFASAEVKWKKAVEPNDRLIKIEALLVRDRPTAAKFTGKVLKDDGTLVCEANITGMFPK